MTGHTQVLPVNGTAYMYLTGILELTVALIFIGSMLVKASEKRAKITLLGLVLLVGTLTGALLTEFFVRPEPITFLVQLSCFFIVTSIIHFVLIRKHLNLSA